MGFGRFKSLETKNTIRDSHRDDLPALCEAIGKTISALIENLAADLQVRDIEHLQLLTLGVQFDGAMRNSIGQEASAAMFAAVRTLATDHIVAETSASILVRNSVGRTYEITNASDPDIRIERQISESEVERIVAIEVKGGLDLSNIHNRAGEAEKSHNKARADGFTQFWTVISRAGYSDETLSAESPTTTRWLELRQVLERKGPDWEWFRDRITSTLGT